MASCLTISDYAVVLGKTGQTDWALQLEAMPVAPTLALINNRVLQYNILTDTDNTTDITFIINQDLAVRLLWLLQKVLAQLATVPENAAVMLVLPELLTNEHVLAGFIDALRRTFPTLLSHPACQLFPYGRSAALMALVAARQLLHGGEPLVWVIGVDSPATTILANLSLTMAVTDHQLNEPVVWSEGAVALALRRSNTGLNCHYLATDATVNNHTDETALAQLFTAAAARVDGPLSRIYMADNGDSALTACWQLQYPRLAPVITADSQLALSAYVTGELGAAGGLYRFLHLYLGFALSSHTGFTLQCEISARLYRAVAVFSWQQASSISER
jgi:hypothetical protein